MDLSIIIPNYNTRRLLDRCLRSIYQSLKGGKLSFEIIVVDNASNDDSKHLLNTKYNRVIKVFNKTNFGYGKANNQGISRAKGKYVLLLNSDIEVKIGAIEALYRFLVANPRSFAGGRLLNEDGSRQPSCGPMYTLPVIFLMLFGKGDSLGITRSSPEEIKKVDWVSGACLIGQRNSFVDIGLFDEDIFMYMEEVDFFYRAKQKGYSVLFYPGASFVHTGAASSANRKTPVVNIYRGLLYFYHKHKDPFSLLILQVLLTLKALAAITVGRMIGKKDLFITYEQALKMVS